jgi:hypothetical protein
MAIVAITNPFPETKPATRRGRRSLEQSIEAAFCRRIARRINQYATSS